MLSSPLWRNERRGRGRLTLPKFGTPNRHSGRFGTGIVRSDLELVEYAAVRDTKLASRTADLAVPNLLGLRSTKATQLRCDARPACCWGWRRDALLQSRLLRAWIGSNLRPYGKCRLLSVGVARADFAGSLSPSLALRVGACRSASAPDRQHARVTSRACRAGGLEIAVIDPVATRPVAFAALRR
jgi:hypothetical protein